MYSNPFSALGILLANFTTAIFVDMYNISALSQLQDKDNLRETLSSLQNTLQEVKNYKVRGSLCNGYSFWSQINAK